MHRKGMGPKLEGTRADVLAPRRRPYVAYDRATGWQNGHERQIAIGQAPIVYLKTQPPVLNATLGDRVIARQIERQEARRAKRR